MAVGHPLGALEQRHQLGRQHQVAQPHLRRQRLRKGADVDDAAVRVHRLQRVDRALAVAELAVVVVLDDPGAVPPGPLQQLLAPAHRQHAAQRELVRGRHVGQANAVVVGQLCGVDAMGVCGRGEHVGARRLEARARHQVAGFLEHERIARVQQQPRAQVDGLL
jgi:hypothetical protein